MIGNPLNLESKDTNELIYKTENNSETQRTDRQLTVAIEMRRVGICTSRLADVNNYMQD